MGDTPVKHSEVKEFMEWFTKAVMIGIASFSVSYLRDITNHLSSLDVETAQMRTELKNTTVFQNTINMNITHDLEKIATRLDYVEKNYVHK